MTTQRTTHQVGLDPPRGMTETPLSPVVTTLPRHNVDGGTGNAAGASFHLHGHQTRANMSGLPFHLSHYPSNFTDARPYAQHQAPLNGQWQSQQRIASRSFNAVAQSPTLHPMSSTTATVRTNANHAFAGTHLEVRPDIITLPPVGPLLRCRAEPPAPTMPQDPPTSTAIPITVDGKRYLCQCGHQTKTIFDMERHHESLKHSDRKHVCACGKKYSRKDSLARHKKKCAMNTTI